MQEQINNLVARVEGLEELLRALTLGGEIPLELQAALQHRGFLFSPLTGSGIPKKNANTNVSFITPISGVFYVSLTNGGTLNRQITFTDGVLTGSA